MVELMANRLKSFLDEGPAWKGTDPGKLRQANPRIRTEAAVVVVIRIMDGQPHVLLTKRSMQLKSHPGEICFPGGTRDPHDVDPTHTGLREADEEVGLHRSDVEVLGVLKPLLTRTRLVLFPVLCQLCTTDFVPVLNEAEVQFSFWLPLRRFLLADNQSLHTFQVGERTMRSRFFTDRVNSCGGKFEDVTTFGITAWICCLMAMAYFNTCPPHLTIDFGLRFNHPINSQPGENDWNSLLSDFYRMQNVYIAGKPNAKL